MLRRTKERPIYRLLTTIIAFSLLVGVLPAAAASPFSASNMTETAQTDIAAYSATEPPGELVYSGLYFGNGRYAVLDRILDTNIPATVEAVVQLNSMNRRHLIFSNYINGVETSMSVEVTAANQLRYFESGTSLVTPAVPPIFDGEWHTITCVRDLANSRVTFYVNGELFHEFTNANLRNGTNPLNAIHCIGADLRASKIFFDGSVSEVRLWSTIRTLDEIKAGVNVNIGGDDSGLMHLWQFDESLLGNIPQTVLDKADVGNPLHGTLIGFQMMLTKNGLYNNGNDQNIEIDSALNMPAATVKN